MLRLVTDRANAALRVVLVLSLWHAPIPWVHAHDLDGPEVAKRAMLSQHIAEFHSHEVGLGAEHLEWHVHLVLPWCLVHHLPCPDSHDRDPGADDFFGGAKISGAGMKAGETLGAPLTRAFQAYAPASDLAARLPHTSGTGDAILTPAPGRHFFETYGAAAVRDLVGVRLC
jgi:hypothetical protein